MAINKILSPTDIAQMARTAAKPAGGKNSGFAGTLMDVVKQVNEAGINANEAVAQAIEGKADSLHGVMLAVNKADLSFRFLMETRNKLVGAYNEIMRMQV